ncbi:insulinase family protein [Formosa haliotis]|uniref:insulinase family protein n=1 Tax=Formosa haliotis TaxID=1555194 RepID=UPI000824F00D|nr:insulinase family protein [Formosa haliotis]
MVSESQIPESKKLNAALERAMKKDSKKEMDYLTYLDQVKGLGLSVPAVETSNLDNETVNRLWEYNNRLKHALKTSYVYVGGNLPENIDQLISTYIATIEPGAEVPVNLESDTQVYANAPTEKLFPWKKESTKTNFMLSYKSKQPLTFKDKLIAEGIAEFGYINMYNILRKKYGLIYALGANGYANKNQNLASVSIRYVIEDVANVAKARKAMIDEVLMPMSQGNLTNHEAETIKALLEKVYVTSFYDKDRISSAYLKWGLDYGTLYTMEGFKEEIKSISKKDIEKTMRRILNLNQYFMLIEGPEN